MSAVLQVRGISRTFGALRALDEVTFDVERGQIVGFIGPNGAGKTTTMRICSTLDLPDGGDVTVGGVSVLVEPRQVRRRLGFMPDSYGAYPSMTVAEFLDFFARAYGLHGVGRRRTIAQVMEFTGLDVLAEKDVGTLSKGMKQRLCLGKTLLHDPDLMILDEPAAGLDPRARVELRELIRTLAELGKAVLISSHILTELAEMVHAVVVIERGTVRATGTMEDITQRLQPHQQVFVRALGPAEALHRLLLEQPGVEGVRREGDGWVFEGRLEPERQAAVLAAIVASGLKPVEFAPREADLEDLFLSLTEGRVQ